MKIKKNTEKEPEVTGVIRHAGEERIGNITTVIEENYMPYAMSVIMSRAIPEIDGFKPINNVLNHW